MKKRYLIPLLLFGLVVARVAWVSRPEPGDHAELTDTCEYKGFPNEKYRALIAEAKAMLAPHRETIRSEASVSDGRIFHKLPTLARLAYQFLAPSQLTTETMVRLLAMARALDGRVGRTIDSGIVDYDATYKPVNGRANVAISVTFSAPIGTLRHDFLRTIELRLWGRRHDRLAITAFGFPYRDYAGPSTSTEDMLPGSRIKQVVSSGGNSLSFLTTGFNFGDSRAPFGCPDIDGFISRTGRPSLAYDHQKVFAK